MNVDTSGFNHLPALVVEDDWPDPSLPRTTGCEILQQLRSDPLLARMTIVAVTAQDADTDVPTCKAAGFNAYIGQPISRMRFPRQLRRILAGEDVWETC